MNETLQINGGLTQISAFMTHSLLFHSKPKNFGNTRLEIPNTIFSQKNFRKYHFRYFKYQMYFPDIFLPKVCNSAPFLLFTVGTFLRDPQFRETFLENQQFSNSDFFFPFFVYSLATFSKIFRVNRRFKSIIASSLKNLDFHYPGRTKMDNSTHFFCFEPKLCLKMKNGSFVCLFFFVQLLDRTPPMRFLLPILHSGTKFNNLTKIVLTRDGFIA